MSDLLLDTECKDDPPPPQTSRNVPIDRRTALRAILTTAAATGGASVVGYSLSAMGMREERNRRASVEQQLLERHGVLTLDDVSRERLNLLEVQSPVLVNGIPCHFCKQRRKWIVGGRQFILHEPRGDGTTEDPMDYVTGIWPNEKGVVAHGQAFGFSASRSTTREQFDALVRALAACETETMEWKLPYGEREPYTTDGNVTLHFKQSPMLPPHVEMIATSSEEGEGLGSFVHSIRGTLRSMLPSVTQPIP